MTCEPVGSGWPGGADTGFPWPRVEWPGLEDSAAPALHRAVRAVEDAACGLAGADATGWDSPAAARQYHHVVAAGRAELRAVRARLDQALAAVALHDVAVRQAQGATGAGLGAQSVGGVFGVRP